MQYRGEANGNDICTLANDYASSTDLTFPVAEKTRYANKILKTIWSWIFEAHGGWQFQDSNRATFPQAYTNLVEGQQDYDLPENARIVKIVEARTLSGDYYKLQPITREAIREMQLSQEDFQTETGTPTWYILEGDSIILEPAPSYSQDNSLRVYFDEELTTFTVTDTTKEPGFKVYHEALAVGMAMEFAKKGLPSYTNLYNEFYGTYQDLFKKYYSQRFDENYPAKMTLPDYTKLYD